VPASHRAARTSQQACPPGRGAHRHRHVRLRIATILPPRAPACATPGPDLDIPRHEPAALLDQGDPGEPAAARGRPARLGRRHRGRGRVGRQPRGHGQGAGDAAHEIAFTPERVLMQDFTGVPGRGRPGRHARRPGRLGGNAGPGQPAGPGRAGHRPLGHRRALGRRRRPTTTNVDIEYERNIERYQLLRWAQGAFDGFRAVPPGTGICHQVNLEYLSRLVFATEDGRAFCDTLVGTDSHTTMVNGLGVLGWGVGGIEAEAAMLGQPLSMLLPPVVGLRISGELPSPGPRPPTSCSPSPSSCATTAWWARSSSATAPAWRPPARDAGHHRQHEPRVRGHLHHVPHRRGDHRLPALHRARRGAPGPGRGLRQGAGPVAHRRRGAEPSTPSTPARPGRRGALAGRPGPAPGPGRAVGAGDAFRPPSGWRDRRAAPATARRGGPTTRSSPTATWSSPPSPAAPTPRTPRSWWPPACWPSGRRAGAALQALGQDLAGPGSRVVMDYLERAGWSSRSSSSASTWSASAAPPASATRARCSRRLRAVHERRPVGGAVLSGNRNFEGRIHPDVG
jgi:hypothetical protein